MEYRRILSEYTLPKTDSDGDTCYFMAHQGKLELHLIEAVYMNHCTNRSLGSHARQELIRSSSLQSRGRYDQHGLSGCPLLQERRCQLFQDRPLHCRPLRRGVTHNETDAMLALLSQKVSRVFTPSLEPDKELTFSLSDTLSGRFVQSYFEALQTCQDQQ